MLLNCHFERLRLIFASDDEAFYHHHMKSHFLKQFSIKSRGRKNKRKSSTKHV